MAGSSGARISDRLVCNLAVGTGVAVVSPNTPLPRRRNTPHRTSSPMRWRSRSSLKALNTDSTPDVWQSQGLGGRQHGDRRYPHEEEPGDVKFRGAALSYPVTDGTSFDPESYNSSRVLPG